MFYLLQSKTNTILTKYKQTNNKAFIMKVLLKFAMRCILCLSYDFPRIKLAMITEWGNVILGVILLASFSY
uniref:Uncharacterized protein n=1 Tax=Daphnia magna TaxID=35525 RepID=A0A0P6ASB2_9CRUS